MKLLILYLSLNSSYILSIKRGPFIDFLFLKVMYFVFFIVTVSFHSLQNLSDSSRHFCKSSAESYIITMSSAYNKLIFVPLSSVIGLWFTPMNRFSISSMKILNMFGLRRHPWHTSVLRLRTLYFYFLF